MTPPTLAPQTCALRRPTTSPPRCATAFAQAAHVVALEVVNQRLAALTLEPRTVLAYPDPADGRLTLRMSTQMPSGVRDTLIAVLGLPRERLRVVVGDVGGGF